MADSGRSRISSLNHNRNFIYKPKQSTTRMGAPSTVAPANKFYPRTKLKGAINTVMAASAIEKDMRFREAMYGQQNEEVNDENVRSWMLHPDHPVAFYWELLEGVFTMAMLFFEPCFIMVKQHADYHKYGGRKELPVWVEVIQVAFTIFFILDIAFNFLLAYRDESGKLVQTFRGICKHYWRTHYLKIDLFATLMGIISLATGMYVIRFLVLTRCLVFKRLFRLPELAVQQLSTTYPTIKELQRWIVLFLGLIVASYILAILYVLVAVGEFWLASDGYYEAMTEAASSPKGFFDVNEWFNRDCELYSDSRCIRFGNCTMDVHIERYGPYCINSWITQAGVNLSGPREQWVAAYYWALTTMTSVGYGDISASTEAERVCMFVFLLVGAVLFSLVVAFMTQYTGELMQHSQLIDSKKKELEAFFAHRKIGKELKVKILDYFRWRMDAVPPYINEAELMAEMSPPLRRMVSMHVNSKILKTAPLLQHGSFAFRSAIAPRLRPVACLFKEYVIIYGEVGVAMYFILTGVVQIVDKRGGIVQTRSDGSFFGEKSLLRQYRHYAEKRGVVMKSDSDKGRCSSSTSGSGGELKSKPLPGAPHTLYTEDESVRVSSSVSELYILKRDDFNQIMFDFPEFEQTLQFAVQVRDSEDTAYNGNSAQVDCLDDKPRPQTPPADYGRKTLQVNSWAQIRRSKNRFQDYYKSMLGRSRTLQAAQYTPQPMELENITLPPRLDPIILHIAHSHHEQWAQFRINNGWSWGRQRNNKEKLHPELLPWEELEENSKKYNKDTATDLFKIMQKLGFTVVPPHGLLEETLPPDLQSAWDWQFGKRTEKEKIDGVTYEPKCPESDKAPLPNDLHELVEDVALIMHDRWASSQITKGWKFGKVFNEDRKQHNGLIPYQFLLPNEKDRTRNAALAFFNCLRFLQCHIVRKSDIDGLPDKFHRAVASLSALRRMHRLCGTEAGLIPVEGTELPPLRNEAEEEFSDDENAHHARGASPQVPPATAVATTVAASDAPSVYPSFDILSQLMQQNVKILDENAEILDLLRRLEGKLGTQSKAPTPVPPDPTPITR